MRKPNIQTSGAGGRLRGAFFAALFGAVVLGACGDLTVPNYNNPDIGDIETNPTRSTIINAATGLLIGARANLTAPNAYVSLLGILGRESYNFDGSEPRFVTEMLVGPMNPGSPAFGANLWGIRYQSIRNANLVLNAVAGISDDPIAGLTPTEKEAVRGFAKTLQAHDFLLVINTRDVNGAAIDVNRPLNAEPAPLVPRDQVFAHIVQLLNEAQAHLQAAGSTFPHPLSSGFAEFATPQSFLEFNRALKARVDVYMENYDAALSSLEASFLDTSAPLDLGAYHSYGAGSGETPNGLVAATIRAHPSLVTEAELQPGGQVDRRVQQKITTTSTLTQQGIGSDRAFTIYSSGTSPVPIIRNEELILLRAEARWFTGDRLGAIEDINFIRVNSGGLAPIALPLTDEEFITELLRQRRYSLLFEGGHSWIDARRFGRLNALPLDLGTHTRQPRFPIPEAECLARGPTGECSA